MTLTSNSMSHNWTTGVLHSTSPAFLAHPAPSGGLGVMFLEKGGVPSYATIIQAATFRESSFWGGGGIKAKLPPLFPFKNNVKIPKIAGTTPTLLPSLPEQHYSPKL